MLKQSLQQKLLQKLSPQQIQLMKMIQLPTLGIEQRIKEEMEINPALEEGEEGDEDETPEEENEELYDEEERENKDNDDDFSLSDYMDDDEGASYKLKANNTSPDEERREMPNAVTVGFHDLLESQLGLRVLDDHQYQVAHYLLGNIDDDGYMRRDLESVVDDIAFSQNIITTKEELEQLLAVIQELDPPGVGARDLQECLLLQLKRKSPKTPLLFLCTRVLEDCMEEFSKKHYEKIAKKMEIDDQKLKEVIGEILKLNPRPGNSMADNSKISQQIVPDFVIQNIDGNLELSLNSRNVPDLRVAKVYSQMMEEYAKRGDKLGKEALAFVKQKIESAKGFIDCVRQREQTLLLTMKAIMDYQKEFFREGDETKLKPMILKDISDRIGLDLSTVSRVSNSKYVQTPFGTYLLKFFFSESIATDEGEEVSSREVKRILADSVAAEDKRKPLTDDELAKILREKGYKIARRTVAKYREMLEIPVARMRKQL